jgi:hypothetical protein
VLLLLNLISPKISISQALLAFLGNSSNSNSKVLEKNRFSPSSRSSALVLQLLYGVTSTLRQILGLCTLCNRSLNKIRVLATTVHSLRQSLYTSCKESLTLFLLIFTNRNRPCQRTPCGLCAHLALTRKEKRFKFLCKHFKATYTRSKIHSFLKRLRQQQRNCKHYSHHTLDQFFSVIFIQNQENGDS